MGPRVREDDGGGAWMAGAAHGWRERRAGGGIAGVAGSGAGNTCRTRVFLLVVFLANAGNKIMIINKNVYTNCFIWNIIKF